MVTIDLKELAESNEVRFSDDAWDKSVWNGQSTQDYCNACILNLNDGPPENWTKANCKLPVKTPDGAINRNALRSAAAYLPRTDAPLTKLTDAKKTLDRLKDLAGIGKKESEEEEMETTEITIEAIQIGPGIIRREGPYIISPVHLTHEGVANRILKEWDEICDPDEIDGVHSFEGCLITRGHPPLGMGPEVPALGKIRNVECDHKKKRADAEAWLVEKRLTGNEVEALESGNHVPGSLSYGSNKIYLQAPEVHSDGSEYDIKVKRPLRANHYALLQDGETPACPTCGFNVPKEQMEAHIESHRSESQSSNCSKRIEMTPTPEPGKGSPSEPAKEAQVTKAEFEALQKQLAEEKAAREKLEKETADRERASKEAAEKAAKEAIEKASKEAAEAKAEVEKLRAEARLKVHIETATSDYGLIHESKELGSIMADIEAKAPETYKKLAAVLKAANERIKAGDLFKVAGSSATESSAGTAWEKIERAAKELQSKDSKLSMAAAQEMVIRQHPDWYTQHRQEVS